MEEKKSYVKFDSNSQPIESSEEIVEDEQKIINIGDMEMLIGKVLTLSEVLVDDSERLRSFKKAVKHSCWDMWELLDDTITLNR